MKESSRLLISLLSHFGHSLKNIETVFREATEELIESKDANLNVIGNDSSIALSKLSAISNLISSLEEESGIEDPKILALKNLLTENCPDEGTSVTLEIQSVGLDKLSIDLPCKETVLYDILNTENNNIEMPDAGMLLIRLLYTLAKEDQFTFLINGKNLS